MSFGNKRPAVDVDERFGVMVPEPKRRAILKSDIKNIMGVGGLSLNRIVRNLEPMLRSWVREEVESVILSSFHPSSRSSLNQIEASRGRSLQLRFVNSLPSTIFTGSKVEAEDGKSIRIILVDAARQTVVSSGSLSCSKLEIVVLDGDFGADEREDWTEKEFNTSVLREREGKRPLVTGDLNITMTDGMGIVDNVVFTDNSSWIRSRKFRLGARVVQRNSSEVTIREARSEAFVVKDHRGELYKKHYPPQLHDEVWRLERIAKDGAFHKRLSENNIHSVKDFLRLHVKDSSALRTILGGGISNRVWDTIIEHALSCALDDDEWYTYYGTTQTAGLLFNSIFQVVAVTFDGQNYQPVEQLAFSHKLLVEDVKRQAYKNIQDLVLTNKQAIMGPSMSLTNLLPEPLSTPNLFLQQPADYTLAHQGQPDTSLNTQFQVSASQDGQAIIQAFNPMLRNSFRLEQFFPYNGESSLSLLPDDDHFINEDNTQALMPSWTTLTPAWGQGSGFILTNTDCETSVGILPSPNFNVHSQRMGVGRDVCPKAGWLKIRAVIQWRSIRRGAVRRRLWMPDGICI